MITIEPVERKWIQCLSCETTENVLTVGIHYTETKMTSVRLCVDCIKDLNKQTVEYMEGLE